MDWLCKSGDPLVLLLLSPILPIIVTAFYHLISKRNNVVSVVMSPPESLEDGLLSSEPPLNSNLQTSNSSIPTWLLRSFILFNGIIYALETIGLFLPGIETPQEWSVLLVRIATSLFWCNLWYWASDHFLRAPSWSTIRILYILALVSTGIELTLYILLKAAGTINPHTHTDSNSGCIFHSFLIFYCSTWMLVALISKIVFTLALILSTLDDSFHPASPELAKAFFRRYLRRRSNPITSFLRHHHHHHQHRIVGPNDVSNTEENEELEENDFDTEDESASLIHNEPLPSTSTSAPPTHSCLLQQGAIPRINENDSNSTKRATDQPATPFSKGIASPLDFGKKVLNLLPYLWPRGDTYLKVYTSSCMLLFLVGRITGILLPIYYKRLIDILEQLAALPSMEEKDQRISFIWDALGQAVIFVLLRLLQGSGGLLRTTHDALWLPVAQHTTKQISVDVFQHLHNLSHRFHVHRKTGEILRVQERGVSSIVSLMTKIFFNVIPTLVDIVIAVVYFTIAFDVYFGSIVFISMFIYIIVTIILTEWRTQYRRLENVLENEMDSRAVDSLLNFETVKYYNAESFEVELYGKAIHDYQNMEWKSEMTMNLLDTIQNMIIQTGLLLGCCLCIKRIGDQKMTVGQFVLYISYLTQLYGPLNW